MNNNPWDDSSIWNKEMWDGGPKDNESRRTTDDITNDVDCEVQDNSVESRTIEGKDFSIKIDRSEQEEKEIDPIAQDNFLVIEKVPSDVHEKEITIDTPDDTKNKYPQEDKIAHIKNKVFSGESSDIDDFDDDFGAFEETPTEKLEFVSPIGDLINNLLPPIAGFDLNDNYKLANIDKSIYLTEEGLRPMKCYNSITGENRQFLSAKIEILNTAKRGCIEQSEWYKKINKISNDWIFDEKGILEVSEEGSKELWKGASKHNVFKWSTKLDDNKGNEESHSNNSVKRKRIGEKLLIASYKEANAIIAIRLEQERRERLKIEKMKYEREQMLEAEKQKRKDDRAKYTKQKAVLETVEKKKNKLFGGLFRGKSKISKDHISHENHAADGSTRNNDTKELSLKEQMEREGYILNGSEKKKKKKTIRKSTKNSEDDDNDIDDDGFDEDGFDEDENSDDEIQVNTSLVGGYNSIGFDAEVGEVNPIDFILDVENADNDQVFKPQIDEAMPPFTAPNDSKNDEFDGEFGSFNAGYEGPTLKSFAHEGSDDDSFNEFASGAPVKQNNMIPAVKLHRDNTPVISLIDL